MSSCAPPNKIHFPTPVPCIGKKSVEHNRSGPRLGTISFYGSIYAGTYIQSNWSRLSNISPRVIINEAN